jgi:hypothetical protein
MNIDFQQGIITYPLFQTQQSFLARTGAYVSLLTSNGRTDVTFSHGTENYLHSESSDVANAWGPIQVNVDTWLYWDINLRTATRTFGITTVAPIFGGIPPIGIEGQHWFNTTTKLMYVYYLGGWLEVIRVFAAKVKNNVFTGMGSDPSHSFAGTQVGLSAPGVITGRILIDNVGAPIRRVNGKFFTTEDDFFVNGSPVNVIRLEANIISASALENVARYQVVKYTEFGHIQLAQYNDTQTTMIAMSMEDILQQETGTLCVQGVITNPQWAFTNVGAALWIDGFGLLTETDPFLVDPIIHPVGKVPVARVLSPTSIFFDQGLGDKGQTGDNGTSGVPLATDILFGITKLSLPATDANNPIAVGDNDPRLQPYTHPATHPSTIITTDSYKFLTGTTVHTQLHQLADRGLGSLGDVTVPSPTINDALIWNGEVWANTPIVPHTINLTQDVTGSGTTNIVTTLATVNTDVGSFGSATSVPVLTVTAKGQVIAAHTVPIAFPSVGGSSNGVWTFGDNDSGQIGNGPFVYKSTPWHLSAGAPTYTLGASLITKYDNQLGSVLPLHDKMWSVVSSGLAHTVAIAQDGTMWAWGNNDYGQLGIPLEGGGESPYPNQEVYPIQVNLETDWSFVSCGDYHTLAVKTDGTLWTFGSNNMGQLGLGIIDTYVAVPTLVTITSPNISWDNKVIHVAGGTDHSVCIVGTSVGYIMTCGSNNFWQLGDGIVGDSNIFVQTNLSEPIGWTAISCGSLHNAAISGIYNDVATWGDNSRGQLGNGTLGNSSVVIWPLLGIVDTMVTPIVSVACGDIITAAVTSSGELYVSGGNDTGVFGNGIVGDSTVMIRGGTIADNPRYTNYSSVVCGYGHIMVTQYDGTIWACGRNNFGQLGTGSLIDSDKFIQIGRSNEWTQISARGNNSVAIGSSKGAQSVCPYPISLYTKTLVPTTLLTDVSSDIYVFDRHVSAIQCTASSLYYTTKAVRTVVPNIAAPTNAISVFVIVENKGTLCQIDFAQDSNVGVVNRGASMTHIGIDVGDVVMMGVLKVDTPTEINCIDISITTTSLGSIYQPTSTWAHYA